MFQYFFRFVTLLLVIAQSDSFTPRATISSQRISSTRNPSICTRAPPDTQLGMAVCDLDSLLPAVKEINTYKVHRRHYSEASEINDAFEKWTLQLFDDSSNTRSYVCRALVEVAELSEYDSYRKMMQAHKLGYAIIGEYCQEHAEHYKDALTCSGLVCEIYPIIE